MHLVYLLHFFSHVFHIFFFRWNNHQTNLLSVFDQLLQVKIQNTQIQSLIEKYVKNPNNILLCVIPAREDIETDIALDFLKTYDKNGDRTLGILTKIDLMNKNTTIVNYLENNISKDLKLDYGYYAIKNRNKEEMKTKTIHEGITDETNFFKQHLQYKDSILNQRCGIINLSKKCSEILLNNIKENIIFRSRNSYR